MNDLPIVVPLKKEHSPPQKIVKSSSWDSITNTIQGLQTINTHLIDVIASSTQQTKVMKNVKGIFLLSEKSNNLRKQEKLKRLSLSSFQKDLKNSQTSRILSIKEKDDPHKQSFMTRFNRVKLQGSLPNLLVTPLRSESGSNVTPSENIKPSSDQIQKMDNQINMNFRFIAGHHGQVPNSVREILKSNLNPQIVNIKLERTTKSKRSDRASARISQISTGGKRSLSPRISPERTSRIETSQPSSRQTITQFEKIERKNYSVNKEKVIKILNQDSPTNTMSKRRTGSLSHINELKIKQIGSLKEVGNVGRKYSHRPNIHHRKSQSGSFAFGSKVTEGQRERLARFIKDDFVNELIFTKYYKVMDEDQKISALNKLKQQMNDHKVIRTKYQENMSSPTQNFFEQFNTTRRETKEEPLEQTKENNEFDGLMCTSRTRRHQAFEIFTPKNVTKTETLMKSFYGSQEEAKLFKQGKKKDFDYYLNLELIKAAGEKEKKLTENAKLKPKRTLDQEKSRFSKIRKSLLEKLLKCVELKVTQEEWEKHSKIFPTKAFERQGSYAFIKAAKHGDEFTIQKYLMEDRFYIFEHDAIKQTALHWAAKRGHLQICKTLLSFGADVDSIDLGGRTPLYFALRESEPEIVRTLLCAKASPWSYRGFDYKSACKETKSLRYLNKARHLSLVLAFHSVKDRASIWEREVKVFLAPIDDNEMGRVRFLKTFE